MEINAVPGPCGVTGAALYFFESSGVVDDASLALAARAFAFEAEEVFFGHSLTLCPVPPQNMQRLLANRRARSSEVSLPSLEVGLLVLSGGTGRIGIGPLVR